MYYVDVVAGEGTFLQFASDKTPENAQIGEIAKLGHVGHVTGNILTEITQCISHIYYNVHPKDKATKCHPE